MKTIYTVTRNEDNHELLQQQSDLILKLNIFKNRTILIIGNVGVTVIFFLYAWLKMYMQVIDMAFV